MSTYKTNMSISKTNMSTYKTNMSTCRTHMTTYKTNTYTYNVHNYIATTKTEMTTMKELTRHIGGSVVRPLAAHVDGPRFTPQVARAHSEIYFSGHLRTGWLIIWYQTSSSFRWLTESMQCFANQKRGA